MKIIGKVNHFIHDHLLMLLLLMYLLAAFFPSLGVSIKELKLTSVPRFPDLKMNLSLPLFFLSFLLFNAGFAVRSSELIRVFKVPFALMVGLVSNLAVPLLFTLIFAGMGGLWHNHDEVQNVLVGLAFIASMPIAGSSTTWVQNCNGNSALILGLVVFSTLLSPFLSPLVFHLIGLFTTGDYSEDLHEIASQGASSFLVISVVVPSLLGIGFRRFTSEKIFLRIAPIFKMTALLVLLILNYSNASVSLPIAIKDWDLDFLAMVAVVTLSLCTISFTVGWTVPKLLRLAFPEQVALMYGLGMNNNGTGLVLASSVMGDHPLILLPIIFYNLGQQIVAGIFNLKAKSSENRF